MKLFVFFLLNLMMLTSVAQNGAEAFVDLEYLKEVVFSLDTPQRVLDNHLSIEEYLERFHPIHLNVDDQVDFIYKGPGFKGEGSVVAYVNVDKTLEAIITSSGRVNKISKPFPDSPTIIDIHEKACCREPVSKWKQWTIVPIGFKVQARSSRTYHYVEGTEFPKEFSAGTKFRIKNTPYKLRASPKIIDGTGINDHFTEGNVVAEYSKDNKGFSLASRTDETGRIWWFVALYPAKESNSSLYAFDQDKRWVGWMSSRFLEPIYD